MEKLEQKILENGLRALRVLASGLQDANRAKPLYSDKERTLLLTDPNPYSLVESLLNARFLLDWSSGNNWPVKSAGIGQWLNRLNKVRDNGSMISNSIRTGLAEDIECIIAWLQPKIDDALNFETQASDC